MPNLNIPTLGIVSASVATGTASSTGSTSSAAPFIPPAPNVAASVSQTNQVPVANNGTMTQPFGFGFGEILNANSGHLASFYVRAGAATITAQDGTEFSGTAGTASKTNIYVTGGVLTIENKTGAAAAYTMVTRRLG